MFSFRLFWLASAGIRDELKGGCGFTKYNKTVKGQKCGRLMQECRYDH